VNSIYPVFAVEPIKKRKFFEPFMQANKYNLNHLFFTIHKANIPNCFIEFTGCKDISGINIYFKKS